MHRIRLIGQIAETAPNSRAYNGVMEKYVNDNWVAVPESTGTVIARWVIFGKPISVIPNITTGFEDILYPTESSRYVCPDVIELSLTNISQLILPPMTLIEIVNTRTGEIIPAPSFSLTDVETTIDVSSLSGHHRLFFSPVQKYSYTTASLQNNVLTMPGLWFVYWNNNSGYVRNWTKVEHVSGNTRVTFPNGYTNNNGIILRDVVREVKVQFNKDDLMVRLDGEFPVQIYNKNDLVKPTLSISNGSTYIDTAGLKSPFSALFNTWSYRVANPNSLQTISTKSEVQGITQSDILAAVRNMHIHTNLSSLSKLTVVNDLLLLDGVPINPPDLMDRILEVLVAIEGFEVGSHTQPISSITGLVDALNAKASTTHSHNMNTIIGLMEALDEKTNVGHGHTVEDITNLFAILENIDSALSNKSDSNHGHAIEDIVGLVDALLALSTQNIQIEIDQVTGLSDELSGKAESSHTHAIADTTGLQDALDGKSETGHSHSINDVTGLQASLNSKAATNHHHDAAYAGINHGHEISNVAGLEAELLNKMTAVVVEELPEEPVVNVVYDLREQDDVNLAAPGLYIWGGLSYICLVQRYAYDLGKVSGDIDLPKICNVVYIADAIDATNFNLPAYVNPGNIVVQLTNGGYYIISWSSNVAWSYSAPPVLTMNAVDWLVFASADGYVWNGALQIKNVPIYERQMNLVFDIPANDTEIVLPLVEDGTYAATVDWGDGTITSGRAFDGDWAKHTYALADEYVVTITGYMSHWSYETAGIGKEYLTNVTALGALGWTNLSGAFYGCSNLLSVGTGDVSQVTNMSKMFANTPIACYIYTDTWDTSKVTNMSEMFSSGGYPSDTSGWDTSKVTDFSFMFYENVNADPDVSSWDMSKATTIEGMFSGAPSANPDLSNWELTIVENVSDAFNSLVSMTTEVPALQFWNNPSIVSYTDCFTGSVNISNYVDIPNDWKGVE